MARLPPCMEDSIEARSWHKRAAGYWRVFGTRFSHRDQELYCHLVAKITFSPSTQFLSAHAITRGALKNPSWPALILIQLGFKLWEGFSDTAVGRAYSHAFHGSELNFPLPNGGLDYPGTSWMSAHDRQEVISQWKEILDLKSQSRIILSEPPQSESPVPLPPHVQDLAITPVPTDSPSSSSSRSTPASPCPAFPLQTRSSQRRSVAVTIPSPPGGPPPTGSRALQSRRQESSSFVSPGTNTSLSSVR